MRELIDAWNAREEVELQVSFGSSSTLAQHIAKGAPADLFVSANATWIQHLDARGALAVDGRVTLMRSQLVLIEPQTAPKKGFDGWERLAERLGDGRFAVGDSEHVPLGMYAKEGLTSLGVWDSVASQTTNAHNARVALAQVERARHALVSPTRQTPQRFCWVVAGFPADSHSPVDYLLAVTSDANRPQTDAVRAYLTSLSSRQVYAQHHFQKSRDRGSDAF